ncbi:MAG: phage antirepressor KilAC domain-containing protein [Pseudomonas sp.]|nr:phage antirepressor KilAC domain-containing protein [Pseudomonas sp.]
MHNQALVINNQAGATMSSREIAELTGKRHDNVVRDVRSMLGQLDKDALSFEAIYFDDKNRKQTEFILDRIHVECLLTGYSVPLRMRVLERLQELESINKLGYNPNNEIEVLQQLLITKQTLAQQAQMIEHQKPAVAFVERYVAADSGSKGFRQVAKLLNANEFEFRAFLSDNKIMYRLGGEWMPHQKHIDAGRFEVKAGLAGDHAFNQAKFTAKGINLIAGLWAQYKLEASV